MDLTPWINNDLAAQEAAGYNDGYSDGLRGSCRDNTDIDTPYNRGYCRGYCRGYDEGACYALLEERYQKAYQILNDEREKNKSSTEKTVCRKKWRSIDDR